MHGWRNGGRWWINQREYDVSHVIDFFNQYAFSVTPSCSGAFLTEISLKGGLNLLENIGKLILMVWIS
jgi:hypothetical protein